MHPEWRKLSWERKGRGVFARKQNQKLTVVRFEFEIANLPQVIQQVETGFKQKLPVSNGCKVSHRLVVPVLHTFENAYGW